MPDTVFSPPGGTLGYVGIAYESPGSIGTFVASTTFLEVTDATVHDKGGSQGVKTLHGDRSATSHSIRGESGVSGTVNFPVLQNSFSHVAEVAFGATNAAQPIASDLSFISLDIYDGGAGLSHHVSGAKVSKLSLHMAQDAPVTASFDFTGQKDVFAAVGSPSFPADHPFSPKDITVNWASSPDATVITFDVDVDNMVKTQPTFDGNTYPHYIYSSESEVTGKFTVPANTTYQTAAFAGTDATLQAICNDGVTGHKAMTTTVFTARITDVSDPIKLGAITVQEVSFFGRTNMATGAPTIAMTITTNS
jgi:hypothetical protein